MVELWENRNVKKESGDEKHLKGYSVLKTPVPSETDVNAWISAFRKRSIFVILARFNMLLSMYERTSRGRPEVLDVHEFLFDAMIGEELYNLIRERFAHETPITSPVFHRQQLLTLMKRILLESSESH